MVWDISVVNDYIYSFVLDREDWEDAEEDRKLSYLNVSKQTLTRKFSKYNVPDTAIYEFAATLALIYNDTNKYQLHGVASFSVTGVSSTTFKENNVKTPGGIDLIDYIPSNVISIVGEANGVDLTSKKRLGRTVIG